LSEYWITLTILTKMSKIFQPYLLGSPRTAGWVRSSKGRAALLGAVHGVGKNAHPSNPQSIQTMLSQHQGD
jgi:hypothetical protein